MPYVSSSAISRIEYDASSQHLYITFRGSGQTYTYYGVPRHVYEAFLQAGSHGTFYADHIRDQYSAR